MKSFDDFRATLTPEVREEISRVVTEHVDKVQRNLTGHVDKDSYYATIGANFTLAILERYHKWLND